MTITQKRIVGFIVGASTITVGAWLNGYDFDSRGFAAVTTYVFALGFGLVVATFPFSEDRK